MVEGSNRGASRAAQCVELIALTCLLAAPSLAQAVAPSQVTPRSLVPAAMTPAANAAFSSTSEAAAPANAEKLIFRLAHIQIIGGLPDLEEETAALARSLQGNRVSIAQIYRLARDLEQIYARAGYVLVRVVVPPQKLKDGGDVKIVAVDGFIERVDVTAVSENLRDAVSERMRGLIGRRAIKLAEIERAVLLASDLPGLRLKSALARGAQAGGALLILEGEARPLSVTIGADNKLPDSLGRWQSNLSLSENSLLGQGEQIYVTASSGLALADYGLPLSPLRMIGGGFVLPLGADGWTINPEYTNSYTRPAPAPNTPATTGDFERFALRSSFPAVRERNESLTFAGALEYVDQSLRAPALLTDINRNSYGAARLSAAWQKLSPWGSPFQANAQVSQGLGGRDAAEAAASNIPLSRQGAAPNFSKISGDVHLNQAIYGDLRLDLIGRAQASCGKALFLPEQFALDGAEGLSAAANGAFNVDAGATVREELTMPYRIKTDFLAMTASPYVFGGQGWGFLYRPTAVEQAEVTAGAFGLGAHMAWDAPDSLIGGTLGLEIGRLYANEPSRRASSRVNLSAALHY